MSEQELQRQIEDGVQFWCYRENNKVIGVMGIQDVQEVTLIRHAYVRTLARNTGIGGKLLDHLSRLTTKPILIGTWADATWAISFYKKRGFNLVSNNDRERLLQKYWKIPPRQIETSVVLASSNWESSHWWNFFARLFTHVYLLRVVTTKLKDALQSPSCLVVRHSRFFIPIKLYMMDVWRSLLNKYRQGSVLFENPKFVAGTWACWTLSGSANHHSLLWIWTPQQLLLLIESSVAITP